MTPPRAKTSKAADDVAPAVEEPDPNADVAAFGYEQARDALVDIVRTLESGEIGLEESLALWERGQALATRCETWLDGAQARIDAARPAAD